MKKDEITLEFLLEKFHRDNAHSDIRMISLMGGYYLDFLLEITIEAKLKKPNRWSRNLLFNSKVDLLEALGHFEDRNPKIPGLENDPLSFDMNEALNDIRVLNKIRNHYAHNIIGDITVIPEELQADIGRYRTTFL